MLISLGKKRPNNPSLASATELGKLSQLLSLGLSFDRAVNLSGITLTPLLLQLRQISRTTGAALAALLVSMQKQSQHESELQKELKISAAGAKASNILICSLPAVSLLLAESMGMAAFAQFGKNQIALLSLIFGLALIAIASWWMKKLTERSSRIPTSPALQLELAAKILRAGSGLNHIFGFLLTGQDADPTNRQAGQATATAAKHTLTQELAKLRSLSRNTGLPIAGLLETRAETLRTESVAAVKHQIALLPVKLLLPVGVCALPGFVLVGVLPVVLAMLSNSYGI